MKIKPLIAGTLVLQVAVLAYSAVPHEASIKITSSSTDFEVQYRSQCFYGLRSPFYLKENVMTINSIKVKIFMCVNNN